MLALDSSWPVFLLSPVTEAYTHPSSLGQIIEIPILVDAQDQGKDQDKTNIDIIIIRRFTLIFQNNFGKQNAPAACKYMCVFNLFGQLNPIYSYVKAGAWLSLLGNSRLFSKYCWQTLLPPRSSCVRVLVLRANLSDSIICARRRLINHYYSKTIVSKAPAACKYMCVFCFFRRTISNTFVQFARSLSIKVQVHHEFGRD